MLLTIKGKLRNVKCHSGIITGLLFIKIIRGVFIALVSQLPVIFAALAETATQETDPITPIT